MSVTERLEVALSAEDITVKFGGFVALDGVNLSVPSGQRRAIVGPNGAGKTTLINVLQGVIPPATGSISLFGEDVTDRPVWSRTRKGIARTHQITNLFGELTLAENVALAVHGLSPSRWVLHRRADRYLDVRAVSLERLEAAGLGNRADHKVLALSHGEQRQLELAMALANGPRVLLLDEPAAGLSPAERGTMLTLLSAVPTSTTIVMIEHNIDLVRALAEEITVLHHGAVMASATPDEIQANDEVRQVYLT